MAIDGQNLIAAFKDAIMDHPQGIDAGPKVLLSAVQAKDAQFSDVNIMKAKKTLQQLRAAKEAEAKLEAASRETQKQTVAKIKRDRTCPGGHGLKRYLTENESTRCSTCPSGSKPLQIGSPVWGCQLCDYHVCLQRCYAFTPDAKLPSKSQQLQDKISGLEKKMERCISVSPDQEKLEKILGLVTKEIKEHEKQVERLSMEDWVGDGEMTEEEANTQKTWFLSELTRMHGRVQAAIDSGPV